MKTILFQGDSITDCGRDRSGNDNLGNGYPRLIEASLGLERPGDFRFLNRGVSGDRIPDVYARIVRDILVLRPDYMSLLIGVNDVWHGLDAQNGTGAVRFEKVYAILLDELQQALPDMKIMLLEPFVLRGAATDNRPDQPDRFQRFQTGVFELAAIVKQTAQTFGVTFVPLQQAFDEAAKTAEGPYWLADGVHPTAKGHELIKREWLKTFRTLEKLR